MTTAVATVSAAKRALAEATATGSIDAIRDVAAMAAALQKGARARGLGIDAENAAAEVVIRAERSIGAILLTVPREKTGPKSGHKGVKGSTSKDSPTPFEEAVAAAGLNPKSAHQFQRIASLSDADFETLVEALRGRSERLARIDFVRAATPKPDKVAQEARSAILEAWHSEDAIPEVVKFVAAADKLVAHTDALPEEELRVVGEAVIRVRDWYNAQRAARV